MPDITDITDNVDAFFTKLALATERRFSHPESPGVRLMFKDIKFIAQDDDGWWFGYTHEPTYGRNKNRIEGAGAKEWDLPHPEDAESLLMKLAQTELYPDNDINCYKVNQHD